MKRADVVCALALGGFAAALLGVSYQAGESVRTGGEGMLWPRFALWGLLFLSALLLIRGIFVGQERNEAAGLETSRNTLLGPAAVAAVGALYIGILNVGGFLLTSLVFAGVTMRLLGRRQKTELVLVPIVLTAVLYGVFIVLLNVPLPKGSGPFREFTLFFY